MRESGLPAPDTVWCAIPVFNNKDTVYSVALACRRELRHVVVIDDGSTDVDVGALFKDTDIAVCRHAHNRGKGQALLTALSYVKDRGAEFMITVDADGQHQPRDIRAFLPVIAANRTAIVIGARRMNAPNVPASSRFGMRFSDFWLRLETGLSIRDSQSGFRAYPVAYVAQLPLRGRHYDFEIEVLAKAAWAGLSIVSVDVSVIYHAGDKRISHFRPLLDNLRLTHRHVLLVGRRLLPWPHRRLVPRAPNNFLVLLRHPARFCKLLLMEHASPAELGAAAGVGTFLAALPLLSLHTVAIVYVTTRLHLNRIMAVAIQNLCMPPFVPFVCVEIGYFMRNGRWLREVSRKTLLYEAPQRIWEWFLGALIVAPILAIITGLIVFGLAAVVRNGLKKGV